VLVGELLWALTRVLLYGGAFFVVVWAFGLAPMLTSLWALPVIPLAGVLFAALGLNFSLRIANIDLFSFYFTLFLTPLFLFSDVFFPIQERLSGPLLWVAEVLPLLHPVRLARLAFRGEWSWVALWDLAYIVGLSAILVVGARRIVRERLTS
jgi:lipooligosaccharide transport system permease protein